MAVDRVQNQEAATAVARSFYVGRNETLPSNQNARKSDTNLVRLANAEKDKVEISGRSPGLKSLTSQGTLQGTVESAETRAPLRNQESDAMATPRASRSTGEETGEQTRESAIPVGRMIDVLG